MSKVVLDRVTSSFGFQAAFNNILQQIENEFSENVLYRKNPLGKPNSMSVDIDMGSHDLLNVGLVSATDFRINGETLTQSLQDALEEVAAYPAEAMGYRDEALAYRAQAQGFSVNAGVSAYNASLSEAAALAAATNAAADATSAVTTTLEGLVDDAELAASNAASSEATVEDLIESVKDLPIGCLIWVTSVAAPNGYIIADGELRSRVAFPDLWAFAQTSGNISVDDASWTFGQYSPGDGSTTFRVPKVDDRFIRGKSGTRAVGLVEEDAFQGHVHTIQVSTSATSASGGVMRGVAAPSDTSGPISDGINGTPRTADETRPKALTMLPCIKAYDVISDPNVLNAVEVVNEISRIESEKLRKDENINLGVSVAASGTAVDFIGIPEGVKRITVMFDGVSTNGTSPLRVQVGDSSMVKISNYRSSTSQLTSSVVTSNPTDGFDTTSANAFSVNHGVLSMELVNSSTNTWAVFGHIGLSDLARNIAICGSFSLSGQLDRIRIRTVGGTDIFDSGTINISWEF